MVIVRALQILWVLWVNSKETVMYCNPACAKAQRFVPRNPARLEGSLYLHSFMFSRNVKPLQHTVLAPAT